MSNSINTLAWLPTIWTLTTKTYEIFLTCMTSFQIGAQIYNTIRYDLCALLLVLFCIYFCFYILKTTFIFLVNSSKFTCKTWVTTITIRIEGTISVSLYTEFFIPICLVLLNLCLTFTGRISILRSYRIKCFFTLKAFCTNVSFTSLYFIYTYFLMIRI